MRPRTRLRTLPLALSLLAVGCSGVHKRQALDPNKPARVVDGRQAGGSRGRSRAPRVNLRVDPEPLPERAAGSPTKIEDGAPALGFPFD